MECFWLSVFGLSGVVGHDVQYDNVTLVDCHVSYFVVCLSKFVCDVCFNVVCCLLYVGRVLLFVVVGLLILCVGDVVDVLLDD